MPVNTTAIGPDLGAARAEIEALARQAIKNGCPWADGDTRLYFDEYSEVQRADTALLPAVLDYWRDRFRAAAADPAMRRPPYITLLQAQEVLRSAPTRLQNLAVRDPQRFHDVLSRFEAAADDRTRALLLTSAESAAAMLPAGLTLGQHAPPLREAAALLRSLRASGLSLAITDTGRIAIAGGTLSASQRDSLTALRAEVAQLLAAPPTEIL